MKRVLITGIGGFLAHHTMEHLLVNTDWEIVGIDSWAHKGISERVIDSEHYKANRDRVTIFTHDLTAPISEILKNRIGHIDYILAIASQSHVDRSITDPVPFIKNNIDLILNTLEYARQVKPEKFLLVSTDEVYGAISDGGHPEWDSIIPSNPYCLHPDSLVLTSKGYKRIEDIDIMEDLIYGTKTISRTPPTKYQPLNKFIYDYKGKMLRVKTRTQEIVCTPEHRLFCMETFFTESNPIMQFGKNEPTTKHPHVRIAEKRAKDLMVNDKVAVIKKIHWVKETAFNNNFCRFLGYFLGDGSNSKNKFVRWDNIVSIEEFDYEGKVYDLEMPHGNYIAQGMVVHNSASKSAQEDISVSYWRTYGVPLIITNCMNLIGERQDPEKYVPMCIKMIANGETVKVHSQNGKIGTRFYLHARNFSDAMLFLLNNITPAKYPYADRPDRFNIVGKTELDNLQLAQKIADIMGKELKYELVDVHTTRPGHDLRYGLDGSKLEALGYNFPVSFDDSLRATVEWHMKRENEEWRSLK